MAEFFEERDLVRAVGTLHYYIDDNGAYWQGATPQEEVRASEQLLTRAIAQLLRYQDGAVRLKAAGDRPRSAPLEESVLRILATQHVSNVAEMARTLAISRPAVSRVLHAMRRRGVVALGDDGWYVCPEAGRGDATG